MPNRYHPLADWRARLSPWLCQLGQAVSLLVPANTPRLTLRSLRSGKIHRLLPAFALLLPLLAVTFPAQAEVTVVDPWVRTTAPGQQVAAGYLRMMADQPMVLVGASSAFADKVELHDVQVDNGVMKMRQVSEMALEPKRVVELKPGGLHLMLTGIKGPVKAGDNIPLTLIFVDKHNRQENLNIILNGRTPAAYGLPVHGH